MAQIKIIVTIRDLRQYNVNKSENNAAAKH